MVGIKRKEGRARGVYKGPGVRVVMADPKTIASRSCSILTHGDIFPLGSDFRLGVLECG